jgi:hypothetical protein
MPSTARRRNAGNKVSGGGSAVGELMTHFPKFEGSNAATEWVKKLKYKELKLLLHILLERKKVLYAIFFIFSNKNSIFFITYE